MLEASGVESINCLYGLENGKDVVKNKCASVTGVSLPLLLSAQCTMKRQTTGSVSDGGFIDIEVPGLSLACSTLSSGVLNAGWSRERVQ